MVPEYQHISYWDSSKLVVAFDTPVPVLAHKSVVINSLNLDSLNNFLNGNGLGLRSISEKDTLRPVQSVPSKLSSKPEELMQVKMRSVSAEHKGLDLNSHIGKYLFRSTTGEDRTGVICFFLFDDATGEQSSYDVPGIVNLINANLEKLRNELHIPIVAATPNWLSTGTPSGLGGPIVPPIPLPADLYCSSSPGLWPIILPDLPHALKSMTGDGVTVIILDTLPKRGEIMRAAMGAGKKNLLLLDVANNVTFNYGFLPDVLDVPNPIQLEAGKDIYGRLVGFRVPDHGLFIAGIVRDLAPNARVECTRVLNDWCVGDLATLTKAFESIHNRMLPIHPDTQEEGDLYNKPVVVNMSLVIPPSDEDVKDLGFDPDLIDMVRTSLLVPLQSLLSLGAVFVTSAGNEGNSRFDPMNMVRPNALYPAFFAYNGLIGSNIIPVGAVDKYGNAASYSCYPGSQGVATYGGEIPTPVRPVPPDCMTGAKDIDALMGIYTSLSYPALSARDCESRYPVPNANAWAYWSGTSFATPIVSAIAARALELEKKHPVGSVLNRPLPIVERAATRRVNWTNLATGAADTSTNAEGLMIWAVQCKPAVNVDEDEDEEVEINITQVNSTINEE